MRRATPDIWIVGGADDAAALEQIDLHAVAVPVAGEWGGAFGQQFRGSHVVICMPCSPEGRELAGDVATIIAAHGVASIRTVDLAAGRSDGYMALDAIREAVAENGAAIEQVHDLFVAMAAAVSPTRPQPRAGRLKLVDYSQVHDEPTVWLREGWMPLGELVYLAGPPDAGKTTFALDTAAQITTGMLPGALRGKPHDVILVAPEDRRREVRARFVGAGGVLRRLHGLGDALSDSDAPVSVTFPDDIPDLVQLIVMLREQNRPAALVYVDDVVGTFGAGKSPNNEVDVRGVLESLRDDIAHALDVTVLYTTHFRKSAGSALDRVAGHTAFTSVPRSGLSFDFDSEQPDTADDGAPVYRLLSNSMQNVGRKARTLVLSIRGRDVMLDGSKSNVPVMRIEGERQITSDEIARAHMPGGEPASGEDVRDAIIEALESGEHPSREVKQQVAASCDVSGRTVERVAHKMIDAGELLKNEQGFPMRSFWSLAAVATRPVATGVATDAVATAHRQPLRAIPGFGDSSSDTRGHLSLLEGAGSDSGSEGGAA
jgi:hypothetical protein